MKDVYFLDSTSQIVCWEIIKFLKELVFAFSCSIDSTHVAYCLNLEESL
jgi:hypothetical protein